VKFSWKRSGQIGAAYVGAVVGAGFASGQEIAQFFLVFGSKGILGLALLGLLFSVLGMAVLFLVEKHGVETYQNMIRILFGRKLAIAVDLWVTLFLLTGLCVMLAGGAAIFSEHLELPGELGLGITATGIGICLLGQKRGVLWINTLLAPLLVTAALVVALAAWAYGGSAIIPCNRPPMETSLFVGKNWLAATVLYVSYNVVIGMVILSSLGKESIEGNILGGALGGILLGCVALTMGVGMLSFSEYVFQYEIPMLFLAGKVHPLFKYFYVLVLWLALLTTAIANAFGLAKRAAEFTGGDGRCAGILILAAAVPLADLVGFTKMVSHAYPLFGYAGLPVIAAIIIKTLKEAVN